jgi:hypothetical protein
VNGLHRTIDWYLASKNRTTVAADLRRFTDGR